MSTTNNRDIAGRTIGPRCVFQLRFIWCVLGPRFLLVGAVQIGLVNWTSAQRSPSSEPAIAWAHGALDSLKRTIGRDALSTISLTDSLVVIYSRIEDRCSLAEVSGLRSASYTEMGQLDSAMICAQRVFELYENGCDSAVILRGFVALSRLYRAMGDWSAVDSISEVGLSLWRPTLKATTLRNSLLTNKAIAQASMGDNEGAEVAFRSILNFAIDEGVDQEIHDAYTNMGVMKTRRGQLDSADFYYNAALVNARANRRVGRVASIYRNMASVRALRRDLRSAVVLLDSASHYARLANDLELQAVIERAKSEHYRDFGDYQAAFEHLDEYRYLNDSLLNIEKVKALAEMQEKYESEKKAKQILGLKAENLAGELEKSRVKRMRNIYLFSGLGVVGLAAGLWSSLRRTRRSRAAIQHEKDISEGLLHNILPEEVAAEIKAKGYADVREFPTATVLFTDFKGFTLLSEKLTAAELVAEIDHCFKAFDGIMERYGIEKIKTIGDAYMAAGGLPDAAKGSPREVLLAALEMQDFMGAYKTEREAQGRLFFEMRLGIHTGPVIAGIVGVKKYAYDIWGDTVNTASRMESSGEVGQVNISEATYVLVREQGAPASAGGLFHFKPRGKVQAKGKGEMEMFFVRRSA